MQRALIRPLAGEDVPRVAAIHAEAFPRQGHSLEWVRCNARAYPRMRYYVAALAERLCGFVLWTEKSGFRAEVVLELEQIAVEAQFQGQGVGSALIVGSLPHVVTELATRGATLKHVLVTTRADNDAQRLYRKALGAEVEATVLALYSADEVFMVARNPLRVAGAPHSAAGA